jgi:hypothetical protein
MSSILSTGRTIKFRIFVRGAPVASSSPSSIAGAIPTAHPGEDNTSSGAAGEINTAVVPPATSPPAFNLISVVVKVSQKKFVLEPASEVEGFLIDRYIGFRRVPPTAWAPVPLRYLAAACGAMSPFYARWFKGFVLDYDGSNSLVNIRVPYYQQQAPGGGGGGEKNDGPAGAANGNDSDAVVGGYSRGPLLDTVERRALKNDARAAAPTAAEKQRHPHAYLNVSLQLWMNDVRYADSTALAPPERYADYLRCNKFYSPEGHSGFFAKSVLNAGGSWAAAGGGGSSLDRPKVNWQKPYRNASLMELSDVSLFDFVIGNSDRWFGHNMFARGGCEPPHGCILDESAQFNQQGGPGSVSLNALAGGQGGDPRGGRGKKQQAARFMFIDQGSSLYSGSVPSENIYYQRGASEEEKAQRKRAHGAERYHLSARRDLCRFRAETATSLVTLAARARNEDEHAGGGGGDGADDPMLPEGAAAWAAAVAAITADAAAAAASSSQAPPSGAADGTGRHPLVLPQPLAIQHSFATAVESHLDRSALPAAPAVVSRRVGLNKAVRRQLPSGIFHVASTSMLRAAEERLDAASRIVSDCERECGAADSTTFFSG